MPNPKTGTVTIDVAKAVRESKAGKLEYRTDRGANVHLPIGKKSFDEKALLENYATIIEEIVRAKPSAAKGRYIRTITIATTMGPGIHVDTTRTRGIVEELSGKGTGYSYGLTQTSARRRQLAAPQAQKPSRGESRDRLQPVSTGLAAGEPRRSEETGMLKQDKERIVEELTARQGDRDAAGMAVRNASTPRWKSRLSHRPSHGWRISRPTDARREAEVPEFLSCCLSSCYVLHLEYSSCIRQRFTLTGCPLADL